MRKIIEFVLVTDMLSLKEKLEDMINRGWEIKGFVTFSSAESFAVMQHVTEGDALETRVFEEELPNLGPIHIPPIPLKKEPSISIGNN
jgi:hypothetical protein